ncbi:MAG: hypothetical protein AAGF20_09585 [Pseudomonadota bacterium]
MREYTFKPALLRKTEIWTIKDGYLMRRGGARAVELSTITSGVWNEVSYRGTRSAWLHLTDPHGKTRLEYNYGSEGRDDFLGLLRALSEALVLRAPSIKIKIGYGSAIAWSMFLFGCLGVLFGVFMVAAGAMGMTNQNDLFAIGFGIGFIALTGSIAYYNQPWHSGKQITPAEFSAILIALGAPAVAPPEDDPTEA